MSTELPTLVMMSKDRPRALEQMALHYVEQGFEVVAVDGSAQASSTLSASARLTYLHRPGVPYWIRLGEAMERVRGRSCALAADDDAMIRPAMHEAAALLAEPGNLVRVCGTVVHACQERRRMDYSFPDLKNECLLDVTSSPDPVTRFDTMLRVMPQVYYGVVRSDVAKAMARALSMIPDDALRLAEYLWISLPALVGEQMLLPRLQVVRSVGRPNYAAFVAAFADGKRLSQWDRYPELEARLRAFMTELGMDATAASAALRVLEQHFGQVLTTRPIPLHRRALNWARYAKNPRVVFDAREREFFHLVPSQKNARVGAYPWKCEVARREFETAVQLLV
ncbi:MAG: TIGR00180 family glycosyltransferase [Sandaracinaceae bacterium]|nr:TIGR00180 family glycosyltransferase [Sandaracinaceae bacterium]